MYRLNTGRSPRRCYRASVRRPEQPATDRRYRSDECQCDLRARRKRRIKHGGELARQDLNEAEIKAPDVKHDLLALDEALTALASDDPIKARLVELRFFAGMTVAEAADVLGVSAVTAKRYWRYARAWLHRKIGE